jgi:hypothetical protein
MSNISAPPIADLPDVVPFLPSVVVMLKFLSEVFVPSLALAVKLVVVSELTSVTSPVIVPLEFKVKPALVKLLVTSLKVILSPSSSVAVKVK